MRREGCRERQGPLRIGLVCGWPRADLDGVAGYVARLAHELEARGVEPVVVGSGTETAGSTSITERWDLGGTATAGRALHRLGLDAVHVQFAPSMYGFQGSIGLLPLLIPRSLPLLTTLHEYGSWELPVARARASRRLWPFAERRRIADRETGFLVPRSRAVVVTNPAHLSTLRERFQGRIEAHHIPIGANVQSPQDRDRHQCRREIRGRLGLGPGTRLLAFFGFVHPVKGIRYLLEATARLRSEGEDLHVVVVGGFESLALPGQEARDFRAELLGQVCRLDIESHVTFTGFEPPSEVSRWLLASDVGVLPFTGGVTTKSGSLLTMLDHGLPVVVTAGADAAIEDGRNCVVVRTVRDSEALAVGLRRVLHDDGLRARVSRAGKALAEEHSWRDIARRHADLYREVLA
ncbi:glycosyltransferase family 4 protein [Sinomonas susongensis]|uniref:glycosyltransferase family 4 protein n=1 Tax=Sinomonas susongensis TaxID=1324851 RepID=UPI001108CE41|nr:glycosyltransferase family 4 protein [Sinomonas susongensis]